MEKALKVFAAVLSAVVCFGCASAPDKGTVSDKGDIQREWVEQGITDNFIFARGIGAADQKMDNKTQKMATSRNAAIVSAQYNMLSLVKGVKLEGGITVEKAMETDSVIATSIDASIKGAQVVRSEWTSDDGCVVIIRLSKKTLKEMGLKLQE
ncbi:MAG: hypothetical protein NT145_04050 [Elusimicrobia bacterium]|nr:hypothetical protein [Elusimicrobiota bacterium]